MKTKIPALLIASIFLLQGCAAAVGAGVGAGAGVAGYKYSEGNLETTYQYPLDRSFNASTTALRQSGVKITGTEKDATHAVINGMRSSDSTPVKVDLKPEGQNATQASIRVGTLGDEQAAKTINNQIVSQLKK